MSPAVCSQIHWGSEVGKAPVTLRKLISNCIKKFRQPVNEDHNDECNNGNNRDTPLGHTEDYESSLVYLLY